MNATSVMQSVDTTITPNRQDMVNQYGQKVGLAYVDYEKTMTLTVIPARDTLANAKLESAALLPAVGTQVEFVNTESTPEITEIVTGFTDWIVTGSRVRETNTGPMLIEMDLRWLSGMSGSDASTADIAI